MASIERETQDAVVSGFWEGIGQIILMFTIIYYIFKYSFIALKYIFKGMKFIYSKFFNKQSLILK